MYLKMETQLCVNFCGSVENVAPEPEVMQSNSTSLRKENVMGDEELFDQANAFKRGFKVDVSQIETVAIDDQATEIRSLGLAVYDQGTLERGILNQVEEETRRRDAQAQLVAVSAKLKLAEEELKKVENVQGEKRSLLRDALTQPTVEKIPNEHFESQKKNKEKEIQKLRSRKATLKEQLSQAAGTSRSSRDEDESEIERKVRLGEMTPFGTSLSSSSCDLSSFEKYMKRQKELHEKMIGGKHSKSKLKKANPESSKGRHKSLTSKSFNNKKSILRKNHQRNKKEEQGSCSISEANTTASHKTASETCVMNVEDADSEYVPSESDTSLDPEGEVFLPEPKSSSSKCSITESKSKNPHSGGLSERKRKAEDRWAGGSIKRHKRKSSVLPDGDPHDWNSDDSDWICTDDEYSSENDVPKRAKRHVKREVDDGNEEDYYRRVKHWERQEDGVRYQMEEDCHEFDHGYKIPLLIWSKLYKYQQIGVRWLWELQIQRCGGILGDEMGLGKTIQIISFLAGLSISKLKCRTTGYRGLGPTLIICPTTVMHQWLREFHTWFPPLRVAILHESGCYVGKRTQLVREIVKSKGIIITSYTAVVRLKDCVINQNWHYIILDEGHKIRNPDAQVTLVVKQLRTPHRLILSGSPMQNNLRELWSLFDFVFPGKLGTLPVFMQEFAVPITQGGYSNASEVMVATAFKCATVLRDTISPYLLRRMKSDVSEHIQLPNKSEQVLFCRLTEEQRNLYKGYLECGEVSRILEGRMQIFVGLINLRKICNHPHLYSGGPKLFVGENEDNVPIEERYGYWNKAGKMIVIEALLKMWRRQDHRVLIFTQSRQMLLIMENFVMQQGYSYLKLDGGTSIAARQPLINKFNEDKSFFLMLLTTKVGGLGVNLTGANRVVIYDPDWNPATDTQARERAWRIGQKSSVTVYRLITAGTIEEKMYHRQIFKQFLCNKVLKDPRQRRFFKSNDLLELFTLKETDNDCNETAAIFAGTGSQVHIDGKNQKKKKLQSKSLSHHESRKHNHSKKSNLKSKVSDKGDEVSFSQAKVEHMKKLAHELSLKISQKAKHNSLPRQDDLAEDSSKQSTSHKSIPEASVLTEPISPQENSSDKSLTAQKLQEPPSEDELENMKLFALELTHELSHKVKIAASVNSLLSTCDIGENKEAKTPCQQACGAEDSGSFKESSEIVTEQRPFDSSSSGEKNPFFRSSQDAQSGKSLGPSKGSKVGSSSNSSIKHTQKRIKKDEKSKHKKVDEGPQHSRHKKHKKHKRLKQDSDTLFEGEKVPNLISAAPFQTKSQDEMNEEAAHSAKQDDYVLRKLFAKTGLQTAMQHDKVMASGHADFALVEGEARRVAEDAVKAMKASRRQCWNAVAGVPTWTGTSGSLCSEEQNAVQPRLKFGKKKTLQLKESVKKDEQSLQDTGSSGLLAKIRSRNMLLSENSDDAGPSTRVPDNHKDLLDDIRTFVAFGASVDGRATTDEIIAQFRNRLPPETSALFKQMLMQICEFHRLPSGQGVWKLIPEFNW